MFFIAFLLGAVTLVYVWLKWNYSYWKRNNVPGPEPVFFIGNLWSILTFKKHFGVAITDWYKDYPNEPYYGYYQLLQPVLVLRDAEIIKDILTTNFDSFRNNAINVSERYDPLSATNPFFKKDNDWKEARKTIAPMFSQSKLKNVQSVTNEVGADMIEFIKSFASNTDFSAKDLSTRFTTENVIKATFSIEPGCFKKDEQNEFLKIGQELFTPSILVGIKFLLLPILPKWALELIPLPFVPPSTDRWFRRFVHENKVSRPKDYQGNDLFQALLQIQEKHNYNEELLAGHSLSLFFDGTETSSTALSYAMYELARNPHCQDILHEEVVSVFEKYDGKLTYEALQEMVYLEGVFLESTRINPPGLLIGKVCTKEYTLPKTSKQAKPITITPGMIVNIPIFAIHKDPKYYPDPEEFKPERFNEEDKKENKSTFLTFGDGPRICTGVRFATMQIKVALAYISLNFRIKISPNHKPIVIDSQSLVSYPKDGILLNFESR